MNVKMLISVNSTFCFSFSEHVGWVSGGAGQINQSAYMRELVLMYPPSAKPNITCCV